MGFRIGACRWRRLSSSIEGTVRPHACGRALLEAHVCRPERPRRFKAYLRQRWDSKIASVCLHFSRWRIRACWLLTWKAGKKTRFRSLTQAKPRDSRGSRLTTSTAQARVIVSPKPINSGLAYPYMARFANRWRKFLTRAFQVLRTSEFLPALDRATRDTKPGSPSKAP